MQRISVRFFSIALAVSAFAAAQTKQRTVWDGVYSEPQAARGATAFDRSCANCHSLATEGKIPLVGDLFWKSFSLKTVGELLEYVSNNMPNGNPHSLSGDAYQDIVAAMLKSNGFPAGATELASNTISDVQIIPRDGSTILPANALVRVVGCLAKSGTDWVVTRATAPERAEHAGSANEDAAKPLGSRTMTLKFVVTKLDALVGSRVAVNGLLIGADGIDGINVTTVSRVAPKCP